MAAKKPVVKFEPGGGGVKQVLGDLPQKQLMKIALFLEAQIKIRCPVDTGTLRSSYHVTQKGKDSVEVGTNVEYAAYVEYGTKFQHAQPHVRPAIQVTQRKFGKDRDIGENAD